MIAFRLPAIDEAVRLAGELPGTWQADLVPCKAYARYELGATILVCPFRSCPSPLKGRCSWLLGRPLIAGV